MAIRCVWEHNGKDTLLYSENYIGAFARGASKEEALMKMPGEIEAFQRWKQEAVPEDMSIQIVQEKESDLQVKDADSDVLFHSEEGCLSREEYRYLKARQFSRQKIFLRSMRLFQTKI